MRKILASLTATAVLVGGGIMMVGVTADPATAQESELSSVRRDRPLRAALEELVDEGVLTQDQADAVIEKLAENFDGDRRERHPARHGFAVAAEVIGIPPSELVTQLVDGSTIAEVAEANGVDPQAVIDALVAKAEVRLAAAVEDGRITQEVADERLVKAEQVATDLVNGDLKIDHPEFASRVREFGQGASAGTDTSPGA